MPLKPGTRRAQTTIGGLGKHFTSPKRPRDKKQTQRLIENPGQALKRRRLLDRLELLQQKPVDSIQENNRDDTLTNGALHEDITEFTGDLDPGDEDYIPSDAEPDVIQDTHTQTDQETCDNRCSETRTTESHRRILPDVPAERLYASWKELIPNLVSSYLHYMSRTVGRPLPSNPQSISLCKTGDCPRNCECSTLAQVLLHFGLFPTAPSQPRMAVSVDLLAFYRALFERSCDAVNALASALHTHYVRRGFRMINKDGTATQEPFRRSLGSAVQWYDILQVEVNQRIEAALQACVQFITPHPYSMMPLHDPPTSDSAAVVPASSKQLLTPGTCASVLLQRCPACFGGTMFGRSITDGGDIHVATDGNFHHRHRRSAGDSPSFYDPTYFLPKQQVDEIGAHIEKQRKKPHNTRKPIVPDEAIDSCEASYEAADGKKQKASMESFDDTGLMALICRHDIPLFFANIDSPGEQQKYVLALIKHLFTLLPSQATIVTLYDVGCVVDRSLSMYDILPKQIMSRLRFATTAMHAYGHEWACQLTYNPRMVVGLGLSDGEGTERLWSRLTKLIGLERSSSRQRRIWLIDRQAMAIGAEMRNDLGEWIKRRLQRGVHEQGQVAQDRIEGCGVPAGELEAQWASQKKSQLSIRAHAPARLKKELDAVLTLQADVDTTVRAIQNAKTAIEKEHGSDDTLDMLGSLERTHDRLMTKVDALYASLNVCDKFPELKGVSLDFVRILLLARDLKINIRKRAIGSFFEWDKLDRAVGGAQQALGTKLHQQTRKAIAKRQPALMSAIRKYNSYCEQLEKLYDPTSSIPLPTPLPTKLNELRNHQSLMEDLWISPSVGEIPHWINNQDVRDGIRAMLKRDRCLEERRRLAMEADNICCWYGTELAAVELALCTQENEIYHLALQQRREELLTLPLKWSNPLAPRARFNCQITEAMALALALSGRTPAISPLLLNPALIGTLDVPPEQMKPNDDSLLRESEIRGIESEHDVKTDSTLVEPRSHIQIMTNQVAVRERPPIDGFPSLSFDSLDISRLASPTACINDVCINGCIPLLFSALSIPMTHDFAVFSTHHLTHIRYRASDHVLWKSTAYTKFWTKSTWIIPIHRPLSAHWVLCIARVSRRELQLFDSLGEPKPWRSDIEDVTQLIIRLMSIAKQKIPKVQIDSYSWMAYPVTVFPLQSNNYDCGIWVLASIAAVLRGYDVTGLSEGDITCFRQYLHALVLSLPVLCA
ncbi:hypothetical protein EV363DRAFT_1191626 [Boletus edulis]|nr:hypothetical protein EV363DRAFT_1191626 [Boletus edulis]